MKSLHLKWNFDRGDNTMKINEIMTKTPACCLPETSLRDVAKLMVENDCGAIPVVENFETNKPVGIITDRDITVNTLPHGKNALEMTSAEIMSFPAISVKHDANLEECCKTMEDHKVRRMIVVDEAGGCCGIVAQADVARIAPMTTTGELVQDVSVSHQTA
jgi:CBS domain-containing protein